MSSNLGFSHEENDRDKREEGNLKLIRYMPHKNDKKHLFSAWLDRSQNKFWSVDCEGGSKQCEPCKKFRHRALGRLEQFDDVRITDKVCNEHHVISSLCVNLEFYSG